MTLPAPLARAALLALLALAACDPQAATPAPVAQPNPAGDAPTSAISRTEVKTALLAIKNAAVAFQAGEGRWPKDVAELLRGEYLHKGDELDPWGRPYLLEAQGNAVKVRTYGADGKPGGQGPDQDWDSGEAGLGR